MRNLKRWRKVDGAGIDRVESFLRAAESSCVSACARFLRRDAKRDPVWFLTEKEDPYALLFYYKRLLFPIFLGRKNIPLPPFMRRFPLKIPIYALQGLRRDVETFAALIEPLGYRGAQSIDYDLMNLDAGPFPLCFQAGPPGLVLRKPGVADLEALFPLQAAYEREEVLPRGSVFNPAAARLALEHTLAQQHVLTAELDGRIVGKINTNAEAFSRYQIGGVYVLPQYRGQGIATRMTAELARQLVAGNNKPDTARWGLTLFVKKSNHAARKIYRRVGFTITAEYRIAYYRNA
ncbi:MAG: GNAT family N-acetyltransferase [Treponema sp.]|jgi:ribosomal protein S18 acetylase RimI-like enzyme|nr:GNAT family N-acetyltransferase [Treponema sp.]